MLPDHDIANAATFAVRDDRRLGKAFHWSEQKEIPGYDGAQLPFEKSNEQHQWIPDEVGFPNTFQFGEYLCDSLEARLKFRELVSADASRALIGGVLAKDLREQLDFGSVNWGLPVLKARNKRTLVDAPRAFFTLDVDKLDLSGRADYENVFEADERLPDIIFDLFDEAGLNWLICNCVLSLSSSHGVRDPKTIGVHLDYHLSQPLTLAQQKHVANYINEQARAAKILPAGKDLVDPSIYESTRLLFTSAPDLRVYVNDGKKIVRAHSELPLTRVRHVWRGQPRIEEIPDAAFKAERAMQRVREITRKGDSAAREIGARAAGKKETTSKLAPGYIHRPVRDRIYATVKKTPAHRLDDAKEKLKADLVAEVMALDDGDAHKLEQRLRVVSGEEFERSWKGALDQRCGFIVTDATAENKSAHSVDAARNALNTYLKSAVKDGIEFAHKEDAIIKIPNHVLIDVPPGIGKTHAALAAMRVDQLMTERISYLTPRVDLSEEASKRMRARLPKDEYTQGRVRHHKGRSELCKSEEYGKLAERVEALGLSPYKSVCCYCPLKDACEWYNQQGDKGSGLVFGQHAHATTSLAKIRNVEKDNAPSVGIIDETMLSTLVKEPFPSYKLSTLRTWAKRVVIRNNEGHMSYSETNDAIAYRTKLLDALSKSTKQLRTNYLYHFREYHTARYGDDTKRGPHVFWAIKVEQRALATANNELTAALKEYHEARAVGRSPHDALNRIRRTTAEIRVIKWFQQMYRAVEGSLSVEGREYVFGVRVSKGRVSLTIRADLPVIMQQRQWIWLDGTADPDVWRAFLPKSVTSSTVKIRAAEGPYTLYQYADRPYGKRMFTSKTQDSRSNIARLACFVRHQANVHSKVLVAAQQEVERALIEQGLPSNVQTIHFNDKTRGTDIYKDYPCAIIVGRPMPTSEGLEVLTEGLYFDDVDVPAIVQATDMKHRDPINLKLAGGREAQITAESHPDPRVRSMMNQIAHSEVKQAVHRLRLFDRTEVTRAEIHLFGQTDTGLVITELRTWLDADYDQTDMLLAVGVVSGAPEVMAKLLPGLSYPRAKHYVAQARKRGAASWPERKIRLPGAAGSVRVNVRPGLTDDDVHALLRQPRI